MLKRERLTDTHADWRMFTWRQIPTDRRRLTIQRSIRCTELIVFRLLGHTIRICVCPRRTVSRQGPSVTVIFAQGQLTRRRVLMLMRQQKRRNHCINCVCGYALVIEAMCILYRYSVEAQMIPGLSRLLLLLLLSD